MDLGDGKDVFDALPTRVQRAVVRVVVVALALSTVFAPALGRHATEVVVRTVARASCQQMMKTVAALMKSVQPQAPAAGRRADPCRY
jgi:hypothetical protein